MVGGVGVAQAIDAPYTAPLPPATSFEWISSGNKENHHTIQLVDVVKAPGVNDDYWWEYAVNQKVPVSDGRIRQWGLGACRDVVSDPEWNGPEWLAAGYGDAMTWTDPPPYITTLKGQEGNPWNKWNSPGVKMFRVKVSGAWSVNSSTMSSAIKGWNGNQQDTTHSRIVAAPGCNGLVDLGITKTLTSAATVEPGGTVSYAVTVTNNGWWDLPAGAMTVSDPGADLTPTNVSPALNRDDSFEWTATKSVAASTEVCGTTVTNTASVSVTAAPPLISAAQRKRLAKMSKAKRTAFLKRIKKNTQVAPLVPTGFIDPIAGNNSASAAGVLVTGGICPVDTPLTPASLPEVVAFRPASAPALTVEKTGTARVVAGGNLLYRITVRNTGTEAATGVVLNETPPGTMVWRAVPAGATRTGRNVSWNIGTLEGGQSVTKSIRLQMRRTATGRSCNVASATSTNAGSARDRACTTVSVASRPATPVTG